MKMATINWRSRWLLLCCCAARRRNDVDRQHRPACEELASDASGYHMPPYQRMPHQKPGAGSSGVGPRGGAGGGAVLWAEGLSLSVRVPATGKQSPFSLPQSEQHDLNHNHERDEPSCCGCCDTLVAAPLLQNLTLRLVPGEVTALLGPSASGKTTLLNVLSGRQMDGKISGMVTLSVDGTPATATQARQLCGVVPQDNILLPGMTVHQTLWYAAAMRLPLTGGGEREARVLSILTALGLFDCSDVRVDSAGLSGGQRKLVSIALEMLTNPAVLLLDEAVSGLDSAAADKVLGQLRMLARGGAASTEGEGLVSSPRTIVCSVHQPSGACEKHPF
jgi:ABC-type lipoprotein export system ATPase subunit